LNQSDELKSNSYNSHKESKDTCNTSCQNKNYSYTKTESRERQKSESKRKKDTTKRILPTGIDQIHRIITGIGIPISSVEIAQTATDRVLLRPPAQGRVVVAGAELVEAGAAVEEAARELPGISDPFGLMQHVAVGIVVVGVLLRPVTFGHSYDGAQAIEEEVVPVTIRRAFVVQEPTTTAHIVHRASTVCLPAQPQPTVVKGGRVDRHPVALVRPAVGVRVAANVLGLVFAIIRQQGPTCRAGQVAVTVVAIRGRRAAFCPGGELFVGVVGITVADSRRKDRGGEPVARRVIGVAVVLHLDIIAIEDSGIRQAIELVIAVLAVKGGATL